MSNEESDVVPVPISVSRKFEYDPVQRPADWVFGAVEAHALEKAVPHKHSDNSFPDCLPLQKKGKFMIRLVGAIFSLFLIVETAMAAEVLQKKSAHSVTDTVDKLAAAVEKAGAKVFARVDHAAGAQTVNMELRPTVMLMFGNPALGTPALQASQSAGLDLPLRVVVYEDENGDVILAYHDPRMLAAIHGVPADAEVLVKMTGALDKLTNAATAP